MQNQKKISFGFGTIFSLIVVYFIFLYSKQQGWKLLAFITKWYLIIIGAAIVIPLIIMVLIISFSLILFIIGLIKVRSYRNKSNMDRQAVVDIEYKVKEQKDANKD